MASVELILAAVAAADLCLKYGTRLVGAYQTVKHADESVGARVLVVEAIWSRTTTQIEFVKRIAKSLEPEHCRIHLEVFEMLQIRLARAVTKIESVLVKGDSGFTVNKVKYLLQRDAIDHVISELEQWQRIFDPTWYLILRMGDKAVDTELSSLPTIVSSEALVPSSLAPAQKFRETLLGDPEAVVHISLREDGLNWKEGVEIAYSTCRIIPRADLKKRRTYVVNTIICTPDLDIARTRADAEALAKKLSQVDPSAFGLLSCNGLIKRKDRNTRQLSSLNLVFHMPEKKDTQPVSLRHLLLHGSNFSLTRILNIARQLAGAVSFVHTCDFVHKNIRPETVLVFPDETCPLGSAYLLGFDSFRSVHFHTLRTGDAAWERNLYRHPSRQGIFAQDAYGMQHDVYSLGVCLLELGLWKSFVIYESPGPQHQDGEDGSSDVNSEPLPSDALGLGLEDFTFMGNQAMQSSPAIKDHLVEMARLRLPMCMGDKYTAVVVTCLTCLDPRNEDFGDEEDMKDDDGILIGVRFIEKVLLKLSEISF
ncbi:Het-s domain-containingprotein [Madurella fahalii]|uniref:Het-s domain-containingprotein n=1 Tax=Madurella fahalii TaxID=1157608 RepID=A0ABQ0GHA1_9PEZI